MNRINSLICGGVCTFLVGLSTLVIAAPAAADKGHAAARMPLYKPPMRGAPDSRVGGGTRGTHDALNVSVLAPPHTGLTTEPHPALYWYVSKPSTAGVEVTLIDENGEDPLVETSVASDGRAGIHSIDLAAQKASLKPGVEYRWFVALTDGAGGRSNDVMASGTIRRVAKSPALKAKLASANQATRPAVYAEEGVWYDAVDTISRMISNDPQNRTLRAQRAALLGQVGLDDAAAEDQRVGGVN